MTGGVESSRVCALAAQDVRDAIMRLARSSSIEMNVQDAGELAASRQYLAPGTRVYVSHLPRQTWDRTTVACRIVREHGYRATPHVPVRLLASAEMLDRVLSELVRVAAVDDVLLIAGDYPQPAGPYGQALDVVKSGILARHGIRNVSFAGHPEGHPSVAIELIRAAEREKVRLAVRSQLVATLLTQFFFEAEPFLKWASELRGNAVDARLVAGLCGPAKLTTLLKYAMRCGVGQSIRALGARPSSLARLINERGPENLVRALAEAQLTQVARFDGVHLFCFGGFLRTCRWLRAVADGRFALNDAAGFDVAAQ